MKYILVSISCFCLIACNNRSEQQKVEEDTTTVNATYNWSSGLNDSSGRLEMKKVTGDGPDSLTVNAVINYLNQTNPNIKLVLSKTSNDTIYLNIPDATYLTQQMGSTGPTMYLANVIYNLTEVPGYRHVTLDFDEGDHAAPGTYNRDSFKDE